MEKTCRLGRNRSSIWQQELRKCIDQILPPSFCGPRGRGAESGCALSKQITSSKTHTSRFIARGPMDRKSNLFNRGGRSQSRFSSVITSGFSSSQFSIFSPIFFSILPKEKSTNNVFILSVYNISFFICIYTYRCIPICDEYFLTVSELHNPHCKGIAFAYKSLQVRYLCILNNQSGSPLYGMARTPLSKCDKHTETRWETEKNAEHPCS